MDSFICMTLMCGVGKGLIDGAYGKRDAYGVRGRRKLNMLYPLAFPGAILRVGERKMDRIPISNTNSGVRTMLYTFPTDNDKNGKHCLRWICLRLEGVNLRWVVHKAHCWGVASKSVRPVLI